MFIDTNLFYYAFAMIANKKRENIDIFPLFVLFDCQY